MAASESIVEQILANVKTQLAAIREGNDYHYTPTVERVDDYTMANLDSSAGEVIYLVRDTGDERAASDPAEFGENAREFDIFVLAAYKDTRDGTNPYTASAPISGTIRNRMIRDITKKLLVDVSRGGLAILTSVFEPKRDADVEGWIVAEIPAVVLFHFEDGAP